MNYDSPHRADARDHSVSHKSGEHAPEVEGVKAALDRINTDAMGKVAEVRERLHDLEQRVAADSKTGYHAGFSVPLFDMAEISADRDFQRLQAHEKGASCTIKLAQRSVKSLFNDNGDADTGNSLYPTRPDRLGIVTGAQRPLSLFDVLPIVPTTSNAVEYVRLSLAGEAGVQPGEGELKQEGELTATLETARIETIAVWTGISAQCLADTGSLINAVGNVLRNAVRDKAESQLFVGSGIGSGFFIEGLYTRATAIASFFNSVADRIGSAITTMEAEGFQPSLIALNPTDWFALVSVKDTNQNYILGNPANPVRPSLWNRPVLTSASVPQGTALIIDASKVAILDREMPGLYMTRDHLDWAVKNMVLVLAEIRLSLAVHDPGAVRKVDLSVAT